MAGDLEPGTARLGWYADGLPESVSPSRPVMLRNNDGRIYVTALVGHQEPLSEYFHASLSTPSPLLDPPAPTTGLFADPMGTIALAGGRYGPGTFGSGGILGRIDFDFAVVGGESLAYEEINGLDTSVDHLFDWLGRRSPQLELLRGDDQRVVGVAARVSPEPEVRLARQLNLTASSSWSAEPGDGDLRLANPVTLRTSLERGSPWWGHIRVHHLFCDLLSVAADVPLGVQSVRVQAHHDPLRTLDGAVHGRQWLPAMTSRLPPTSGRDHVSFLFSFSDVGAVGVHRWLALNEGPFHGGMDALRGVFRPKGGYLEARVSSAAVAVEKVGHHIGIEKGAWLPGQRVSFFKKSTALAATVPGLVDDEWAKDLGRLYRALKHPDEPESSGAELSAVLDQTKRLLRAWVAVRIGADREDVTARLTTS